MASLSFKELQQLLLPGLDAFGGCPTRTPWDVFVVPSLSFEESQISLVTGAHHYEERQLFELIRLRQPQVRMVYVTSKLLPELVVDAVLELLPGVPISHARQRLKLFDTDDASPRPLAAKLLERPRLLERIKACLRPNRTLMTCFMVSHLERELSERLQLPLLGCDPALNNWGSKAGSRELFSRCELPHPLGSGLQYNLSDLCEASAELVEQRPGLQRLVVKLNEGFSGEGNAVIELTALQLDSCNGQQRRQRIAQVLENLPMPTTNWRQLLSQQGALVEEWLSGGDLVSSPSVQGLIHPGGEVEVLSTHEQILGGASGQNFLGCSFPARHEYRLELHRWGQRIGAELAMQGALERFAVDALARRINGRWDLQAIEVNLRKGGTTHPLMALRYLSNGRLDERSGSFLSPRGSELFYAATDNLCDNRLRGLLPMDLIDLIAEAGLHYDALQERGSVFHLLGCLSEHGKLGMTCIGRSSIEAQEVFSLTEQRLLAHR
jgi:hypothetical protein